MAQIDNLAVQLYSLRNLQLPFDEILGEVAKAGFSGVETVGSHNLNSSEMNALLEKHKLKICSSHVALQALESDFDSVCQFHKEVGNDTIIVPWIAPEARSTSADGWQALGSKLAEFSKKLQEKGFRLLYHNHDFEMAEYDGKLAIDWLFAGAEGSALGFEPDIAWIVRGNQDPIAVLNRYKGRCPRAHVKDLAPAGENKDEDGWAHVGHGRLNWQELLPAAKAAGADWLVVEHDNPKDPIRFLKESADFLGTAL